MNLHQMEQALAEKQAINTIIERCAPVVIDGRTWYNTFWPGSAVAWEVKYLRMRGMLMHHDKQPYLVAIRGKQ